MSDIQIAPVFGGDAVYGPTLGFGAPVAGGVDFEGVAVCGERNKHGEPCGAKAVKDDRCIGHQRAAKLDSRA